MRVSKSLIFSSFFLIVSLFAYIVYESKSDIFLTNASGIPPQTPAFAPVPSMASHGVVGTQVVQSLLGLKVEFQNEKVTYAGLTIVNDPRYQALTPHEKLIDAIHFQPVQAPAFLLLIAIGKSEKGTPIIVPGKFDIIGKTERGGLTLKDTHGRGFYYSGYILATPAWQNLLPGQALHDSFCKESPSLAMCPPKSTVKVLLKKNNDSRRDIPFLAQFS